MTSDRSGTCSGVGCREKQGGADSRPSRYLIFDRPGFSNWGARVGAKWGGRGERSWSYTAEASRGLEPVERGADGGGGGGGEGIAGGGRGEKRREWERPTHRRMRPAEGFNWESWGFGSLGAAPPSIDGRRNAIVPALLCPLRYLRSSSPPTPLSL